MGKHGASCKSTLCYLTYFDKSTLCYLTEQCHFSTVLEVHVPALFPADGVTSISPLDITVEIGGTEWNTSGLSLNLHDHSPPEVVRIYPVRGPLEGDTIITVFGTGFQDSDECVFNTSNGMFVSSITFWNSSTVQCGTPPLNVTLNRYGSVNDEIAEVWIQETSTGQALRSGFRARFWYHPTPTFDRITPDVIQDIDVDEYSVKFYCF